MPGSPIYQKLYNFVYKFTWLNFESHRIKAYYLEYNILKILIYESALNVKGVSYVGQIINDIPQTMHAHKLSDDKSARKW